MEQLKELPYHLINKIKVVRVHRIQGAGYEAFSSKEWFFEAFNDFFTVKQIREGEFVKYGWKFGHSQVKMYLDGNALVITTFG